MHTIAIVGSRYTDKETKTEFTDYKLFCESVDDDVRELLTKYHDIRIISGGAKGVDRLAERYADEHNYPFEEIKPKYGEFKSKLAPLLRNTEIAQRCDSIIAIQINDSRGTTDVVVKARNLNKSVILIALMA